MESGDCSVEYGWGGVNCELLDDIGPQIRVCLGVGELN